MDTVVKPRYDTEYV
ncbi:MAG: hypothetical protein ACEY3D_06265 [Rickettsia sp.]